MVIQSTWITGLLKPTILDGTRAKGRPCEAGQANCCNQCRYTEANRSSYHPSPIGRTVLTGFTIPNKGSTNELLMGSPKSKSPRDSGMAITNSSLRRRRESKTNGTTTLPSLTNQTLVELNDCAYPILADTPKPPHQTCASYQIRTKLNYLRARTSPCLTTKFPVGLSAHLLNANEISSSSAIVVNPYSIP